MGGTVCFCGGFCPWFCNLETFRSFLMIMSGQRGGEAPMAASPEAFAAGVSALRFPAPRCPTGPLTSSQRGKQHRARKVFCPHAGLLPCSPPTPQLLSTLGLEA